MPQKASLLIQKTRNQKLLKHGFREVMGEEFSPTQKLREKKYF